MDKFEDCVARGLGDLFHYHRVLLLARQLN